MTELSTAAVRENLAEVINQVAYGKERVVLERHGKQLLALVPLEDLRILEELENAEDLKDAKKALRDIQKHGAIPWSKIKQSKKR